MTFGYDKSANEGLAIFGEIWAISPPFSKIGSRWRVQARDIKITPFPQLFVKYEPSIRRFWELRASKEEM